MAEFVYILCALTSLLCTALLWRGYRRSRHRLLLWSSLCFVGLAANNVILLIDKLVYPHTDLSLWRSAVATIGLGLLLFGLVWDSE